MLAVHTQVLDGFLYSKKRKSGFLTKNIGSPNGEKSITLTFTGLTPRC
jgi:hypothetical protein